MFEYKRVLELFNTERKSMDTLSELELDLVLGSTNSHDLLTLLYNPPADHTSPEAIKVYNALIEYY
jgi:hypothetical protein